MSDNPFMRLGPGESVTYHQGHLAYDVARADREQGGALERTRALAWEAYEARRVLLIQRRVTSSIRNGGYQYIAIGR